MNRNLFLAAGTGMKARHAGTIRAGVVAALVAVVAVAGALGAQPQVAEGSSSIICRDGEWFLDRANALWHERFTGIPCTEAKPGWLYRHDGGDIIFVYDTETVRTGSYSGPLANAGEVLYSANSTNRSSRGYISAHSVAFGYSSECYREWHDGNRWRRSASYGTSEEACRRAAWNTYNRSRGLDLLSPDVAPPQDGYPPGY